ncbi:MAG: hypothetical protein ACXW11_02320 [Methylotenera sp.]
MFWFRFRKKLFGEKSQTESKIKPLYEGDRGISDLYANKAELRVWVPESLNVAMKEAVRYLNERLSEHLRQLLVVYLYGAHELLCMSENETGIFHPEPPPEPRGSQVMFSRARVVDYIPGLGKNIVPLKLFLHEKMKADLQALADKAGVPLSQFVREVLVSHFLGHTVWPERNVLWTRDQLNIAEGWELGAIEEDGITSPTEEEEVALEGKVEVLHW